jgi:hypothetical protein
VTWNIAFEWAEFMRGSQVNRVAEFVDRLDPWDHLMTVHNHGLGSEPAGSDAWLDFYSIQEFAGTIGDAGEANDAVVGAEKPVFAQEVVWEGEEDGKLDDDEVRQGGWGVIVGAGLLNYAEQFFENGGVAYGDGGGLVYVKVMMDIAEDLDYWRMTSRNDLVAGGDEAYCLAESGRRYLVYAPNGGQVRVDLRDAPARFDAQWIDPRTGSVVASEGIAGGAYLDVGAPTSAADWVLVLTAEAGE